MAQFVRFDICEAYSALEYDYNEGGILQSRPSCQRQKRSVRVQLWGMNFKPRPSLAGYETLSENGKEIYLIAAERLGLPLNQTEAEFRNEYEDDRSYDDYDYDHENDYGDYDHDPFEDDDLIDGVGFADPGGRSALRAATESNPRDQPCPNCGAENVLTRIDVARGYQCNRCADRAEQGR